MSILGTLSEKFSAFVEQHISGKSDGADVLTPEDIYEPDVLLLADWTGVAPAIVRQHNLFCNQMGIEITSLRQGSESLKAFISLNQSRPV